MALTSPSHSPASWTIGDSVDLSGIVSLPGNVVGILGEGGMGIVYKIAVPGLNLTLAMKSPKAEIFIRADGKENFLREALIWVNLAPHHHLVRCYGVKVLRGIPHIFSEYMGGGSLADWIRQRKLYTLYTSGAESTMIHLCSLATQFAWGLHAAHKQGLIHQDVKPANVLVTPRGYEVAVSDFGLAKAQALAGSAQEKGQNMLVSAVGMTPAYCSPEQLANRPLSHKTDIWSWGVSVLEMFTGEVTWRRGDVAGEALAHYEPRDPLIPVMPPGLVTLLTRCFQQDPEKRPSTMLEVATELQEISAYSQAVPFLMEMPVVGKPNLLELSSRANSLLELGRREEALAVYDQIVQLYPDEATAYFIRGNVLDDFGRLQEALTDYEQANRLSPKYADVSSNKGHVLRKLGRLEEALTAYDQAIGLLTTQTFFAPEKMATAYFNKAVVLRQLNGRTQEALATYKQALSLDPVFPDAYYGMGNALLQLDRLEEAVVAYDQVIRLNPSYTNAYYKKGEALQKLKHFEEALAAFEQTLRLQPHDVDACFNKGVILERLGRFQEAVAAYDQTLRLHPTLAQAYQNKGDVLQKLGKTKEAEQVYQKARDLHQQS